MGGYGTAAVNAVIQGPAAIAAFAVEAKIWLRCDKVEGQVPEESCVDTGRVTMPLSWLECTKLIACPSLAFKCLKNGGLTTADMIYELARRFSTGEKQIEGPIATYSAEEKEL
jgi:hypothetical protein